MDNNRRDNTISCVDFGDDVKLVNYKGYRGYKCDPEKATTCKKTGCGPLGTGGCYYTTNSDWKKNEGGI